MKAEDRRTSPMMVDIWFLKVSLPASHLCFSLPRLCSKATLRSTYSQTVELGQLMSSLFITLSYNKITIVLNRTPCYKRKIKPHVNTSVPPKTRRMLATKYRNFLSFDVVLSVGCPNSTFAATSAIYVFYSIIF